ncbi:MAG: phospho-sugar mutase [Puniceicoccales bacterium]|jgi:phosphoglucomutase|nr:phospho-sugar mutase [Puniceicoccales bacterium]
MESHYAPAIQSALGKGLLSPEAAHRLRAWLQETQLPLWARHSLEELMRQEAWEELQNRFRQELHFGTGGLRGRTIGSLSTETERGTLSSQGSPKHPAVGSACLNDFNLVRATLALHRYCADFGAGQKENRPEELTLVVAHDVRHFSSYFCQLAAQTWALQGGICYVFDGPRSTPQLSFTVRELGATAGVVITASHNPPHDNGYKAYFRDGAQMIDPHASGVIERYRSLPLGEVLATLAQLGPSPRIRLLSAKVEERYLEALEENILEKNIFQHHPPRLVYTPLHGTGIHMAEKLFSRLGIDVRYVQEQLVQDPRFPTVDSPNPEYAATMRRALQMAEAESCELAIGTDPDADRMALGIRNHRGEMELLSGHTTAALLAEFRLRKMKRLGWLAPEGTSRAVLIKSLVTTPLLEAIAARHGVRCINTLTGFKWIGAKLLRYEEELQEYCRQRGKFAGNQNEKPIENIWEDREARRQAMLEGGHFFVFGGEESCGYLASDRVRDKDAHAALLMACEMLTDLAREGKSVADFRDEIYRQYGYFGESVLNIGFEGEEGARKIQKILRSYRECPPEEFLGIPITRRQDFATATLSDEEGEPFPPENFLFLTLAQGYRFAVRGSGTEPKLKFYLFGQKEFSGKETLDEAKAEVEEGLALLKSELQSDALRRSESSPLG